MMPVSVILTNYFLRLTPSDEAVDSSRDQEGNGMGAATDKHFELHHLIQNYRESDRKKCIELCEQGIDNLPAFVAEAHENQLVPSSLYLSCIEVLVPSYAEMGEYDKARQAIRRTEQAKAWTRQKAREKLAWIDLIESIHRDIHPYIAQNPGIKAKDVYPAFPQYNPEDIKWFFDHSDFIQKDKDGRFVILFATNGDKEPEIQIASVVNKYWLFSNIQYRWTEGRVSITATKALKNFVLSHYVIEETDRRISKEYVRLRFWEGDIPGQITLYHKTGNFRLLCPLESKVNDELLKHNPVVFEDHVSTAQNLAWFISPIDWQEKNEIIYIYLTADYTEDDKKFYESHARPPRYVPHPLIVVNFKPEWKIQPSEVNSKRYKGTFDAVQQLLLQYGRDETDHWVHRPVQGISGWDTFPDIIFPTVPDKSRFSADSPWESIAGVVNTEFLNAEEEEIIRQKMYNELVLDPFKSVLPEKWYQPLHTLMQDIQRHLNTSALEKVRTLIPNPNYNPITQIERFLMKLQVEWKTNHPDGNCVFCGCKLKKTHPDLRILAALRGEMLSVCWDCLRDAVSPQPWDMRRRPFVKTREEIVRVVRELALETGVLPISDPLKYLSQVPKEKLLSAVRLLRTLPYESLRRDLYPEGWSQILSDAGLLDQEVRSGIGIRCTAEDGHVCRSLSEKFIDDWLYRNHIPHEVEPPYPYDHELNTSGMRADFLVEDVWIEFFGLMNRPDYRAKTELKNALP
jgi:hypothetical protein